MTCIPYSPFSFENRCPSRMGGIESIVWGPISQATVNEDFFSPSDSEGCYIDLDLVNNKFARVKGRGSFQSVAQVNEDNGSVYWRDELSFAPEDPHEEDLPVLMAALAGATDDALLVIAEGPGGPFVLGMGFLNTSGSVGKFPVWLSAGSIQSGLEHSDFNGGQLTLASVHPLPAVKGTINSGTIL